MHRRHDQYRAWRLGLQQHRLLRDRLRAQGVLRGLDECVFRLLVAAVHGLTDR